MYDANYWACRDKHVGYVGQKVCQGGVYKVIGSGDHMDEYGTCLYNTCFFLSIVGCSTQNVNYLFLIAYQLFYLNNPIR